MASMVLQIFHSVTSLVKLPGSAYRRVVLSERSEHLEDTKRLEDREPDKRSLRYFISTWETEGTPNAPSLERVLLLYNKVGWQAYYPVER